MKNNLVEHPQAAHVSIWNAHNPGAAVPQLRLNVLTTGERATVAALRASTGLAANLGAQITLIAAEVVPWQFPLNEPPIAVPVLERKLCRLVYEAGIVGQEVRIQLSLCREERQGLRRTLRPHSLIVVGKPNRWWSQRERNLKQFLTGLGHQVIFVRVDKREDYIHVPAAVDQVSPLKRLAFHNVTKHTD